MACSSPSQSAAPHHRHAPGGKMLVIEMKYIKICICYVHCFIHYQTPRNLSKLIKGGMEKRPPIIYVEN